MVFESQGRVCHAISDGDKSQVRADQIQITLPGYSLNLLRLFLDQVLDSSWYMAHRMDQCEKPGRPRGVRHHDLRNGLPSPASRSAPFAVAARDGNDPQTRRLVSDGSLFRIGEPEGAFFN